MKVINIVQLYSRNKMLTRFTSSRSFSRFIHQCKLSTIANIKNVDEDSTQCVLADSSKPLPLILLTSGVPIHLYTRNLESQALKQLINLAESGIAKGFIAAMADVHVGKPDLIIKLLF